MRANVLSFNSPKNMKVNRLTDGLELIFTPDRSVMSIFIICFLGFWLMGWLAGEVSVLGVLISGKAQGGSLPFLIFWLLGWTVGGFFAGNVFLAMLFGKRVVTVKKDSLQIFDRYGLWIKNNICPMSRIRNLRRDSEEKRGKYGPYTLYAVSVDCDRQRTVIASTIEENDLIPLYELLANSGYFGPAMMTGYMSAPSAPQSAAEAPLQNEGDSGGQASEGEMYYPDIPEDLK